MSSLNHEEEEEPEEIVQHENQDEEEEKPQEPELPKKGLFSMKFMQKNIKNQVQETIADREMTHADVMLTSRRKYLQDNASEEELANTKDPITIEAPFRTKFQ